MTTGWRVLIVVLVLSFLVLASEIGTHGDWSNPGTAADAWFHARDAVLRSVENGVPMARSARPMAMTTGIVAGPVP